MMTVEKRFLSWVIGSLLHPLEGGAGGATLNTLKTLDTPLVGGALCHRRSSRACRTSRARVGGDHTRRGQPSKGRCCPWRHGAGYAIGMESGLFDAGDDKTFNVCAWLRDLRWRGVSRRLQGWWVNVNTHFC